MNTIPTTTVHDWLAMVARPSPVWAAGSVLAITSAQGWALIQMIAGLADKRGGSGELGDVVTRAQLAQDQLMQLAEQDAQALRQTLKTPSPEALWTTAVVPLEILRWCHEGVQTSYHPALRDYGPARLDLAAAHALFSSAAETLGQLVEENAAGLPPQHRDDLTKQVAALRQL